jgi:hypothetical protein
MGTAIWSWFDPPDEKKPASGMNGVQVEASLAGQRDRNEHDWHFAVP